VNHVIVYSHFFTVQNPEIELRKILYTLAADYTVFGMVFDEQRRKRVWKPVKTFGFYTKLNDEFRFHIGQLNRMLQSCQAAGIYLDVYHMPLYEPCEESYPIQPKFVLRAEQEEAAEFIIDMSSEGSHAPLLSMPMGSGKTICALTTASRIGKRLAISVLAGYVEKWNKDVLGAYEINQKDIYRIEGKNSLVDYCQLVLENQETPEKLPKVTIISINTISKWYKGYIEDPFNPTYDMYGMKPWELMEKARIGTNIFDESHQHLHAVYRMFCFLHIPKTISLSATLTSEDETELRIQRMMYPRHKRFEKIKMKRYITVYSCQYQIQDFANSRIRTQEYGSNNYSHIAFEKSILSSHVMKSQYVDMIVRMVKGSFVKTMQAGDKCAVFVSSHAMAREVCKVLRKALPDLDTRTYLESDPIENLMDSDIRVTTVLSGGTAHDIGGLTVSIQTINLNSIKSNLQVLGRLREIAGRDIRFYYLYCSSIPKHVEYHQNKIEMFRDWCKERKDVMLDPLVPKSNPTGYIGFKRF